MPQPVASIRLRLRRALTGSAWLALAACSGIAVVGEPSLTNEGFGLHPRWRELEPYAFERWLTAALPADAPLELSSSLLDELEAALAERPTSAVRSALILARSRDPRVAEVFLRRLETRFDGPERASDAGDVISATALLSSDLTPAAARVATRERLATLALGPDPHPDLEVRVECAATASLLGSDAVTPFLLRVLRIGTPAGLADPKPWADVERSAWARGRAATVLSRRAGIPVSYRTDASLADRDRAVDALEARLAAHSKAR